MWSLQFGFTLTSAPYTTLTKYIELFSLLLFKTKTFCFPNLGLFFLSLFFPVVFLENEIMYGQVFNVTDEVLSPEFVLPIGKAKVEREGWYVGLSFLQYTCVCVYDGFA